MAPHWLSKRPDQIDQERKQVNMGSSQNQGPILVPLIIRCRNIIKNQKASMILGTTLMGVASRAWDVIV